MKILSVEDGVVTLMISLESDPAPFVKEGVGKKGPWKGTFTRLTETCYRTTMAHPEINDGQSFQATVDFTEAKFS